MAESTQFEIVQDYQFKPRDKVLVIDANGYDLWDAVVKDINAEGYVVYYPEYPNELETLPDASRLLVQTKENMRIFRSQEIVRSQILPPVSDGEEPQLSEDESEDEDEDGYEPEAKPAKNSKKKAKDKKPLRKRPEWARCNPPRSATHKNYVDK